MEAEVFGDVGVAGRLELFRGDRSKAERFNSGTEMAAITSASLWSHWRIFAVYLVVLFNNHPHNTRDEFSLPL